ncbi:MAG: hypothetical protein IPL75_13790 [Acidobacteria bacterium]|nr:hypothetical protein [Acidobacteriota bacterium]
MLELAIGYANRGQAADAINLLEAATAKMRNPLLRAWLAYLQKDASALGAADVSLVFPYRLETLPVLTWAAQQNNHWSWTYLRALNLWAFDRLPKPERLLTPLGNTPDAAAFYVSRAHLVEKAGGDPEPDLKRAETLAGTDRTVRIPLIQHYQKQARWSDALAASARARQQFPKDFNLALLHVRSRCCPSSARLRRLRLLNVTRVLPQALARNASDVRAGVWLLRWPATTPADGQTLTTQFDLGPRVARAPWRGQALRPEGG